MRFFCSKKQIPSDFKIKSLDDLEKARIILRKQFRKGKITCMDYNNYSRESHSSWNYYPESNLSSERKKFEECFETIIQDIKRNGSKINIRLSYR